MSKVIDNIKKKEKQLFEELWDNAAFDDASYATFEHVIEDRLGSHKALSLSELCFELTTVRNRNLITVKEQKKLRKTVVAFFGLSVGSHAGLTWMMESRADAIKLVDFDKLSAVNLNRLRFGWEDIGKKKVDVVTEYLKNINPFAEIYSEVNVNRENIIKLLDKKPEVNIIVDAIDSIKGKIMLRQLARERHIPLISAADVGDNIKLDIERYDEKPQPNYFLGRISNIEKINIDELSTIERKKLIIKLVGFEHNSERMLDSLLDIGDAIATWPQLGATATIAGGIVVTTIKKIILGEKVVSGRYYFSLDRLLVSDFDSASKQIQRKKKILKIKKRLGLNI